MRYTPLGWGIFSIARGKKFVKAYHGDFLRFYAGEPLFCGKQNPVLLRDVFLHGVNG